MRDLMMVEENMALLNKAQENAEAALLEVIQAKRNRQAVLVHSVGEETADNKVAAWYVSTLTPKAIDNTKPNNWTFNITGTTGVDLFNCTSKEDTFFAVYGVSNVGLVDLKTTYLKVSLGTIAGETINIEKLKEGWIKEAGVFSNDYLIVVPENTFFKVTSYAEAVQPDERLRLLGLYAVPKNTVTQ